MPWINWAKNFDHDTTETTATPLRRAIFWWGLAPTVFEIFLQKKFWRGFRPIPVTHWQENQISWKKWRFEIFGIAAPSRRSPLVIHALGPHGSMSQGKVKIHALQYSLRRSRAAYIKLTLVFHHLPSGGPKQLCALAHLGCTREAGTS